MRDLFGIHVFKKQSTDEVTGRDKMAPDKPGLHNGNYVTKLVLIVKIQLKKKEYNISHLCQVNMVNKQ